MDWIGARHDQAAAGPSELLLSDEAATELLASRYPVMTPRVRRRLLDTAWAPACPARTPGLPRRPGSYRGRNPSRGAASRPPAADGLRLPRPGPAGLGLWPPAPPSATHSPIRLPG